VISIPRFAALTGLLLVTSCGGATVPPPVDDGRTQRIYNKQTGRLEEMLSDRDGDGKKETHAYMDGVRFVRIEMDENGDGKPDRFEFYTPVPAGVTVPSSPDGRVMLERVEEAGNNDGRITRKEFYVAGVIARAEEDTDGDKRVDKWEFYSSNVMIRLELDLQGKGFPDRRFTYSADGELLRTEADPDGDGKFEIIKS